MHFVKNITMRKNFSGKLEFCHSAQTIEMFVYPAGHRRHEARSNHALSGGER